MPYIYEEDYTCHILFFLLPILLFYSIGLRSVDVLNIKDWRFITFFQFSSQTDPQNIFNTMLFIKLIKWSKNSFSDVCYHF